MKLLYLTLFCVVYAELIPKNTVYSSKKTIHLTNDNFVALRGVVSSQSVAEVISNLIDKNDDIRYIFLSTNGGSVTAGLKLINTIKDLENSGITVNCIADTAISMGFVIFQACGTRYVLDHSLLMQHQASLGLPPMKIANLLSTLKGILGQLDEMHNMQAKRMGLSLEKFEALIHDDLWLFSGAKAVELNAADKVVTASCSQDLINKKVRKKEIVQMFIFQAEVEVELSLCPLILTKTVIEPKPEEAPAK
jgi:ATP-dependent Clp protease protease subunit